MLVSGLDLLFGRQRAHGVGGVAGRLRELLSFIRRSDFGSFLNQRFNMLFHRVLAPISAIT